MDNTPEGKRKPSEIKIMIDPDSALNINISQQADTKKSIDEASIEKEEYMKIRRHEQLLKLYEIDVDLFNHEARFLSERINIFILFNAILFAALVQLLLVETNMPKINILNIFDITIIGIIEFTLVIIGIFISISYYITIARTINAYDFYRNTIGMIEENPYFWYPNKIEAFDDLDIFHARKKYLENIKVKQDDHKMRRDSHVLPELFRPITGIIWGFIISLRNPSLVSLWLIISIFALWYIALVIVAFINLGGILYAFLWLLLVALAILLCIFLYYLFKQNKYIKSMKSAKN